ncbi:MULE domain-containing protein [Aphis craccivora]|uniref:MULE domain-containing protein n=1 Tax=Aphis craccivora TaxID=307492 RepID=A0A6G0VT44_APHCR|nr:MULE domain-containing protein [Aphis craccivora]
MLPAYFSYSFQKCGKLVISVVELHLYLCLLSFPMVYALTTRMTQLYESFFRIIRLVLPLNYNQLTIITDYERGFMNAVRSVIRYCKRIMNSLFHLFQTSVEAATVLRMVLALPQLPAKPQINCDFNLIGVQFLNAFKYFYLIMFKIFGAANIHVFGMTNNYVVFSCHTTDKLENTKISGISCVYILFNYMLVFVNIVLMIFLYYNVFGFLCEWVSKICRQIKEDVYHQRCVTLTVIIQKLLIVENQYYLEMDQARRHLQVVTSKIRNYIGTLNENRELFMFLKRAGHLMDGYYRKQVRPRPLVYL